MNIDNMADYNFMMSLHVNDSGTIEDYAGNTWTMNNTSIVTSVSGFPGTKCISFPGTGYLYKSSGNALSINTAQDFTVAFWMYFSSVPWHNYNAILLSNGWTYYSYNTLAFNRAGNYVFMKGTDTNSTSVAYTA